MSTPATGRYVESDPIGLRGGNYSTYGYADENPVNLTDPLGLWVKLCSRWLGNPKNSGTSQGNPIRHDYLDVSGQFIGFYSAPGSNPQWGRGVVAGQNEQDGGRCSPLCSDDKFDAYVLAAAQEIGAPTYCAIASAEFGVGGLAAEALGARNCQSWARDVIAKAKQNYLAHEQCPKCFKNQQLQRVFASMWNWILTLLFGTGAAVTPAPVSVGAGETFFRAAKALKPVDDTMRVGIYLGKATEEKKRAVLSGTLKLGDIGDIGDIKVEVCKSEAECVPMTYTGPYFSRDSYGIGFDAKGPQIKHSSFIGVKVGVDRPLAEVAISWSNYSQ